MIDSIICVENSSNSSMKACNYLRTTWELFSWSDREEGILTWGFSRCSRTSGGQRSGRAAAPPCRVTRAMRSGPRRPRPRPATPARATTRQYIVKVRCDSLAGRRLSAPAVALWCSVASGNSWVDRRDTYTSTSPLSFTTLQQHRCWRNGYSLRCYWLYSVPSL